MKRKKARHKKKVSLRKRLAKIFKFSWVRFEDPRRLRREDDEEMTHWYRNF